MTDPEDRPEPAADTPDGNVEQDQPWAEEDLLPGDGPPLPHSRLGALGQLAAALLVVALALLALFAASVAWHWVFH